MIYFSTSRFHHLTYHIKPLKMQQILRPLAFVFLALLFMPFLGHTQPGEMPAKKEDKKSKKKTYADIITDKAETDKGLFTVHKVDDKYYFEIPNVLLEKEILIVSRISGYVNNMSFGGAGMRSRPQQVIRWQKHDNKILLRSVSYNRVADPEQPIYQSVRNNNFEPIIMAFKIAAINPDSTATVIEINGLFNSDVAMIGAINDRQRKTFGIKGLDAKRSMISSMKSFPKKC